jgi:Domain of unknown function (DUF4345)
MKNLHLIISVLLLAPIAFAYGIAPCTLIPALFNFTTAAIDLQNIFRAMMGLYIGMVIIWVIGIFKPAYWETATIVNIFFMSGLALGRLVSFAVDGMPSGSLVIGFFAEALLAVLGYINWKKYKAK